MICHVILLRDSRMAQDGLDRVDEFVTKGDMSPFLQSSLFILDPMDGGRSKRDEERRRFRNFEVNSILSMSPVMKGWVNSDSWESRINFLPLNRVKESILYYKESTPNRFQHPDFFGFDPALGPVAHFDFSSISHDGGTIERTGSMCGSTGFGHFPALLPLRRYIRFLRQGDLFLSR